MLDQSQSTANDVSVAWSDFCDRLKTIAGTAEKFSANYEMESPSLAHRFIMRALAMGWEAAYEYHDLASPRIYEAKGITKLCGSISSDARYFEARLNAGDSYMLSGFVNEAPFIEVSAYEGKLGFRAASRQVDFVTEEQLGLDNQGHFSLIIGPEVEAGRGIKTTFQTDFLMIRVYAYEWSLLQAPSFKLERIGRINNAAGDWPAVPPDALMATADYVEFTVNLWSGNRTGKKPNTITSLQGGTDLSLPGGQRYASGIFDLREDEVLEIEFEPPPSPYWGIQLSNIWSEALDYDGQGSHINNHSSVVDDDGRVRITVSPSSSNGTANHLSTEGHRMGNMTFRMLRSAASLPLFTSRIRRCKPDEC